MGWRTTIDLLLVLPALALAVALRPWRAVAGGGPPWPWLAWGAALPLLWATDRVTGTAILQPLSGASLLVLLAGWPLAMLALLPVALVVHLGADLPWHEVLHRLAWLGVVPGSLALALGLAVRRLLPAHLFVYMLGRGFFVTWIAVALSGVAAWALRGAPVGTEPGDLLIARFLAASGEAFLTGMLASIFVAFRPQWLATYSDRLYLPKS